MKKLKLKYILVIVCVIVLVVLLAVGLIEREVIKEDEHFKYQVTGNEIVKTNHDNIYLYGIKNLFIDGVSLDKYLKDNKIEDLKKYFDDYDICYDGGSKIYSCKDCSDKLKIIYCDTIEGVKDIYIGHNDMKYEGKVCKMNVVK